MFGCRERDFPVTESIAARVIALPFYDNLAEEEVDYVVGILDDIVKCQHGGSVCVADATGRRRERGIRKEVVKSRVERP